jgi:hypothetical protein
MKLPIQAQPILRNVSTAKILDSMLVQPLSLPCSKKGKICGGFAGAKCCSGAKCRFLPGADYGYCDSQPIA